MGVLAPSAVRVPIRKCEVKNGKKKTQGSKRTLSQFFVCEELRVIVYFLLLVGWGVPTFLLLPV